MNLGFGPWAATRSASIASATRVFSLKKYSVAAAMT
jgi:hypothetical protein